MEQIERDLYIASVRLIETRYPLGWSAAAIRTVSGKILNSVAPDTKNDELTL